MFFHAAVLGCAIIATSVVAVAKPADDALQRLRTGTDEVLALVYDSPKSDQPLSARVRPNVEKYFDLETITRRAVGPAWNKFSAEQKKEAAQLFSEVVLRTYADRFDPVERPKISYGTPTALTPKRVELPTSIVYLGKKYSVTYRMEKASGSDWRVTDVIIEGVSMIANYRAQFDALAQKGGPTAVLDSLKDALKNLGPPK